MKPPKSYYNLTQASGAIEKEVIFLEKVCDMARNEGMPAAVLTRFKAALKKARALEQSVDKTLEAYHAAGYEPGR